MSHPIDINIWTSLAAQGATYGTDIDSGAEQDATVITQLTFPPGIGSFVQVSSLGSAPIHFTYSGYGVGEEGVPHTFTVRITSLGDCDCSVDVPITFTPPVEMPPPGSCLDCFFPDSFLVSINGLTPTAGTVVLQRLGVGNNSLDVTYDMVCGFEAACGYATGATVTNSVLEDCRWLGAGSYTCTLINNSGETINLLFTFAVEIVANGPGSQDVSALFINSSSLGSITDQFGNTYSPVVPIAASFEMDCDQICGSFVSAGTGLFNTGAAQSCLNSPGPCPTPTGDFPADIHFSTSDALLGFPPDYNVGTHFHTGPTPNPHNGVALTSGIEVGGYFGQESVRGHAEFSRTGIPDGASTYTFKATVSSGSTYSGRVDVFLYNGNGVAEVTDYGFGGTNPFTFFFPGGAGSTISFNVPSTQFLSGGFQGFQFRVNDGPRQVNLDTSNPEIDDIVTGCGPMGLMGPFAITPAGAGSLQTQANAWLTANGGGAIAAYWDPTFPRVVIEEMASGFCGLLGVNYQYNVGVPNYVEFDVEDMFVGTLKFENARICLS